MDNLFQQFGLRDLVDFITRENFKLDLVLTNVAEYESPTKLAPIANMTTAASLLKVCSTIAATTPKSRRE